MIENAILCLALAIYHEAGNLPIEDQWQKAKIILAKAVTAEKTCEVVLDPQRAEWAKELSKSWSLKERREKTRKLVPKDQGKWPQAKYVATITLTTAVANASAAKGYTVATAKDDSLRGE